MFDKHLFDPAASHARVDPLFRTADCANYKAPNGEHWLGTLVGGSTRNMSSFMFKDICEHQARSISDNAIEKVEETKDKDTGEITEIKITKERDRLYFEICEPTDPSTRSSVDCLNYLVNKSDEICEIHKSHVYGNRTAMNTLLGTLAMGAGIAGTMTGANAAHYLAGASGFLIGAQALMDKEVYQNLVTQAILLEIDTNRKEYINSIAYINQSEQLSMPGIGKIRQDALKYHNMCSFYDGLVSLLNKAGDKTDVTSTSAVNNLVNKKATVEKDIAQLIANKTSLEALVLSEEEVLKKEKEQVDRKLSELETIKATINTSGSTEEITAKKDKVETEINDSQIKVDKLKASILSKKADLKKSPKRLESKEKELAGLNSILSSLFSTQAPTP